MLKWTNKKQNNFNIYNVVLKKKKRITPVDIIIKILIRSTWSTEIGSFRSSFALLPHKNPKIKILKNEKICWRYHHFTHVYQKPQSYDVWFLRFGVRQAEFFVILGHFLHFQHPGNLENRNFKIEKKNLEIS